MSRLLIAAAVLCFVAAPAFACMYHSAATDGQSKTVAAQPNTDQSAPPASPSQARAPS